jgi:hypothetical protein
MKRKEYKEWAKDHRCWREGRFLRSTRDDIVIMGIPTGPARDGFIEGVVIATNSPQYPVGYFSLAWVCEAFEFTDGVLTFEKTKDVKHDTAK